MKKDLTYYKSKIIGLRNAIDLLLEEMGTAPNPPQQRRKLREEKVNQVADDFIYNRKPKRK